MAKAYAAYKKDWRLCSGLLCTNNYLITNVQGCAATDFEVMLCIGADSAICMLGDDGPVVPQMCTLLPFCVVSPKMACCSNVRTVFEADEEFLKTVNQKKLDAFVERADMAPEPKRQLEGLLRELRGASGAAPRRSRDNA